MSPPSSPSQLPVTEDGKISPKAQSAAAHPSLYIMCVIFSCPRALFGTGASKELTTALQELDLLLQRHHPLQQVADRFRWLQ